MKNFLQQIALVAFILIFAASCGKEVVEVEKPEPKPTCHVELVYTPLTSSVIAVEYRVQEGQKLADIVQIHKTNPNMAGGPFLDYTMDMFLMDNPEVVTSTKQAIRKDKCDPTKIDTVWYKAWNLEENNLVYLRVPARLDTVPGNGWNAEWFAPEKTSPIKHLVDRIEIASSNLEKKPVIDFRENPCQNQGGPVSPPNGGDDRDDSWSTVPPNGGGGNDSGFSDFIGGIPNWFWILLAMAFLCWFIYYQHKKTRETVNSHTSAESNETRTHTLHQHNQTRDHVVNQHNQTRNNVAESTQNLGSELIQAITAEGRADRELLERQLDAERKSREQEQSKFFKLLADQGKGPKKLGQ